MQYFKGVPSPLKHPELVNMVIFRENTEDIYARYQMGRRFGRRQEGRQVPAGEMGVKKIRFPESSGIGIKPVSVEGPRAWCVPRSSTPSTTIASR